MQQPYEIGTVIIPTVEIRKLRLRESQNLPKGIITECEAELCEAELQAQVSLTIAPPANGNSRHVPAPRLDIFTQPVVILKRPHMVGIIILFLHWRKRRLTLYDKSTQQTGSRRAVPQPDKGVYENPTVNIFNGERLNTFHLREEADKDACSH